MGYKCASLLLRMAGYDQVVPVDIWALRFLEEHGFKGVRVSDYLTVSGITKGEYLKYEKYMSQVAARHRHSPAMFQLILWCMKTKNAA